jgi:carboxymethylenebutenolidase
MGEKITFPANGRSCEGYLATPAAERARGRGVVVIQEWWGLNENIQKIADRFAAAGYLALAPDLYHGKLTRSPDEAGKLLMALNVGQAELDLRGATSLLRERTGHPVGSVGFCMGGALSLFAACQDPDSIAACVVYYGRHPKIHYDLDALRAPLLGHWAEHDAWANEGVPALEAALRERGRSFEFHHYAGTQHAFFNAERPEVHDPAAAETSWERTLAFFAKHL